MTSLVRNDFIPEPIRKALISNDIRGALQDPDTRAAMSAWSSAHSNLATSHQTLVRINRIVREIAPQERSARASRVYSSNFFSNNFLARAKELTILLHAGLVDEDSYLRNEDVRRALFDMKCLPEMALYLAELPPFQLSKILTIRKPGDRTCLLHDPKAVTILLPLLTGKFTEKQTYMLFRMFSTQDENRNTPLHNKKIITLVMQFLRHALLENRVTFQELMFMENKAEHFPLQFLELPMIDLIKDSLTGISVEQVHKLVNLSYWGQYQSRWNTEYMKVLFPLIEQLPPEGIFKVLSYQSSMGFNVLETNLKLAFPAIRKCSGQKLCILLSMVSMPDRTPFQHGLRASSREDLFQLIGSKMTLVELKRLFKGCGNVYFDEGVALLQTPHLSVAQKKVFLEEPALLFSTEVPTRFPFISTLVGLKAAMPILEAMDVNELRNLFFTLSPKNAFFGVFVTQDYHDYFAILLPLLEKLSERDLVVLLRRVPKKQLAKMISSVKPPHDFNQLLMKLRSYSIIDIMMSTDNKSAKSLAAYPGVIKGVSKVLKDEKFVDPIHLIKLMITIRPLIKEEFYTDEILAFLETLPKWQRIAILFLPDKHKRTALHRYNSNSTACLLLQDCTTDEIFQLLSFTDNEGNTPLHIMIDYTSALPLLDTLSSEQLASLFGRKNNAGVSVLEKFESGVSRPPRNYRKEQAETIPEQLHLVEDLDSYTPEELYHYFSTIDKNSNTFFHTHHKEVAPYLIKLPFSQRMELLSKQNNQGEFPRDILLEQVFEEGELENEKLFTFLDIKNTFGFSRLEYPLYLKYILENCNEEGRKTVLNRLSAYRLFLLVWRELRRESRCEKFYHHLASYFPKRFDSHDISVILSVKNDDQFTAFHYLQSFVELLPLLKQCPVDVATEFLSKADNSGHVSPLHEPAIFAAALPFISTLPIQNIRRLGNIIGVLSPEMKMHLWNWVETKPSLTERFKAFGVGLFLGWHSAAEEIRILTPDAMHEIFGADVDSIKASIASSIFEIRPEHMKEGKPFSNSVPEAIDMNTVPFVGLTSRKRYTNFHAFLPDMIEAAKKEGSINLATEKQLTRIANYIRNNWVATQQVPSNSSMRRKAYEDYTAYLSHVVTAYKVGQGAHVGDLGDKRKLLEDIAEIHTHCFPRWKEQIQQMYFSRPGPRASAESVATFKDRLLACLRAARLDILNHSLPRMKGNVHEINYIRDTLREDLGTFLELIKDPMHNDFLRLEGYDHVSLKKEFMENYYTTDFIIHSVLDSIKMPEDDPMGLPPHEALECITDWYRSKWTYVESNKIIAKVTQLIDPDKIEKMLEYYGISWSKEQTIKEAETTLSGNILNLEMRIRDLIPSVEKSIVNTRKLKGSEEYPLEVKSLIVRYSAWINCKEYDLDAFMLAFTEWKEGLKKKCEFLKVHHNLLNSFSTKEQKREYMIQHTLIDQGQPLTEVLTHTNIRDTQVNIFCEQLYDAERRFTPFAAACLLVACGVFQDRCNP